MEVRWTDGVGNGSTCHSKCNTYISYRCVVTWDETCGETLYISAADKWLIGESGTALIFDFACNRSLRLVLGIGKNAFERGVTPHAQIQLDPAHK